LVFDKRHRALPWLVLGFYHFNVLVRSSLYKALYWYCLVTSPFFKLFKELLSFGGAVSHSKCGLLLLRNDFRRHNSQRRLVLDIYTCNHSDLFLSLFLPLDFGVYNQFADLLF
jgi:hypothetical protein